MTYYFFSSTRPEFHVEKRLIVNTVEPLAHLW